MLNSKFAYLFTEIAGLLIAYVFTSSFVNWKIFLNKKLLLKIALMFLVWIVIDQIAVNLSIWSFPEENSFDVLVFHLPVEEYALFLLHSVYCVVFFEMYKKI